MIPVIVFSLLVALSVVGCSDPVGLDTHVKLQIDADVYHVGEEVQVTLVNHHAIHSDMIWYYPCQVNVGRQDGDGWDVVGVMGDLSCFLHYKRLERGESHEWSFTIDRYHARGGGEASYEPGRTYRFVKAIRDQSREGGTIIYSRPFVVQD